MWMSFLLLQLEEAAGDTVPFSGRGFRAARRPTNYSVDSAKCALCFGLFYESRLLHQIGQEASPGLSGRAAQGQDLRHQQGRAALQGAPRLITDKRFTAMKAEGHPTLNNVCFLDIGTGRRFLKIGR